jgi:hypothetical protein
MGSFRDKFSLSYLNPSGAQADVSQRSSQSEHLPGMEEALLVWGRRIAEVLNGSTNQTAKVFDILDKLDGRADTLLPVINYLSSEGYLVRLQEDLKGNDVLKLTERGRKLI